MADNHEFQVEHIIDGFQRIEASIADSLHLVPYCPEHKDVWSPFFADRIIEACHQLDSLWKAIARQSADVPARELNILDYHKYFGGADCPNAVYHRWVVFFAEEPTVFNPFAAWDQGEYQKLPWWDAYTQLKHDRWQHIQRGTLTHAIEALAGLFIAIVRAEHCRETLADIGWITSGSLQSGALAAGLDEGDPSCANYFTAVESRLFSYPCGWCTKAIKLRDKWWGSARLRFKAWFDSRES